MWIEKLDGGLFKNFVLTHYRKWLKKLEEDTIEHRLVGIWENEDRHELMEKDWEKISRIREEVFNVEYLIRHLELEVKGESDEM